MRKSITTEVHVYFCDICGEPASCYSYPFITMYHADGSAAFESKIQGDYCEYHMKCLEQFWINHMNSRIVERYDCDEYKNLEIEKSSILEIQSDLESKGIFNLETWMLSEDYD